MVKKLLLSFLIIIMVQVSYVKVLDNVSSQYLDTALQRSLSVFALARGFNALISVVQGTQVYATPAGVGVNFAVGQVLDPMNDMVERFSWIMLMSSVSLGVQKLFLEFGQTQIAQVLFTLSALFLLLILWIPKLRHKQTFNLVFKSFVVFTLLRFLIPMVVLFSQLIYSSVLQSHYEVSKQSLEIAKIQTEVIVKQVRQNEDTYKSSWIDSLNVTAKLKRFRLKMERLWKNLEVKLDNVINYMLSLIAVFVIESILLPLGGMWLFVTLFKNFLNRDISSVLEDSPSSKEV